MKTARRSSLEGAVIGRILTIVRGERSITIPARELPDLVSLLQELAPALEAIGEEPPTAFEVGSTEPPVVTSAPEAAPAAPAPARKRPSRARRGRVWEGVKRMLGRSRGRAVAFDELLDMVVREQLTDKNAEHALKIALGKKVRNGELLQDGDGYRLSGEASPARRARPRPSTSPTPLRRRHRPGELWKNMKSHLEAHPEGCTRDELVAAAAAGEWSPARDPEHAVKICLSRVGDQVVERDGRYILTELDSAANNPAPTVRKRRKRDTEEEPAAAAPTPIEAGPSQPTQDAPTDENDPNFDASQFYPTPRSRLPR